MIRCASDYLQAQIALGRLQRALAALDRRGLECPAGQRRHIETLERDIALYEGSRTGSSQPCSIGSTE